MLGEFQPFASIMLLDVLTAQPDDIALSLPCVQSQGQCQPGSGTNWMDCLEVLNILICPGNVAIPIAWKVLAVQKTLDVSVPAKPVHENLSRIQKWLNRALDELEDPDRDAAVTNYRRSEGGEGTALLPDRFAATESLAEKVVVVRDVLERLADELGPRCGRSRLSPRSHQWRLSVAGQKGMVFDQTSR